MTRTHVLSLVCSPLLAAALFASTANAQQGPPPGSSDQRGMQQHDRHEGGGPGERGGEHGMGIVPPGTWWKNPEIVKALTLTPDQIKRLDDTLLASRIQLIHMKASLEEEQIKLEPILNTNPPDQGKALAEISKIADLRADLEKANAKMLLGLRGVLTADQWTKLQAQRHGGHRGGDGADGQRGDRGKGGKGGPGGPGGQGPGAQGGPGGRGGNLGNPPMPPSED